MTHRSMGESLGKGEREQRAAQELADALDAVSAPMAERILGRAIDVESRRRAQEQDTFDYQELARIAGEVGVSEESLQQALLEEFDTDLDRNPTVTERLTLPDEVRGGIIVERSAAELNEALQQLASRIQEQMAGRAEAMVEAVQQPDGLRTLVEVRSSTRPNRRRALMLIAFLVFFGPVLGQIFASLIFVGVAAVAVVAVVGFMKRFARGVRRVINHSLGDLIQEGFNETPNVRPEEWPDEWPSYWIDVWERSRRPKR